MLCERCKIREANIKYTEVMNGMKAEHNLCSQCAKEMDFGHYSAIFDGDFPLGKLLSGLLGIEDNPQKKEKFHHIVCPSCKTSYEEFIKDSRFGCQDCYGVFDLLIDDSIKQIQGSNHHTGKRPYDQSDTRRERDQDLCLNESDLLEEELKVLEAKLKEALKREEYESAVDYRDKIKELKEGKIADA